MGNRLQLRIEFSNHLIDAQTANMPTRYARIWMMFPIRFPFQPTCFSSTNAAACACRTGTGWKGSTSKGLGKAPGVVDPSGKPGENHGKMVVLTSYLLVNVYTANWKITMLLMGKRKTLFAWAIFNSYVDIIRGLCLYWCYIIWNLVDILYDIVCYCYHLEFCDITVYYIHYCIIMYYLYIYIEI